MRSSLLRRGLAAVAVATCASLVATLWPATPVSAATAAASGSTSTIAIPGDAEYLFTRMLNKERTSRGLRALRLDTSLSSTSRAWSREMDSSNTLKHDPNLVAHVSAVEKNWSAIGENVGVGYSVGSLHSAFMNSTGHRANILRSSYNRVGLGVIVEPGGKIWVTVRFLAGPSISGMTGLEAAGTAPALASGDFNNDGRDDLFRHGPGTAEDTIYWGKSGGFSTLTLDLRGSYRTAAGDFNGDGRDDILLYGRGSMPDSVMRWNGTAFVGTGITKTGQLSPIVGDYDGDRKHDIFWYGTGSEADHVWYGTSTVGKYTSYSKSVGGNYRAAVGDFDGNNRDDIFWHAPGTATDKFSYGTGRNSFAWSNLTVNGSFTPTSGDYNGDGRDDIYLYAAGSATDTIWYMKASRGGKTAIIRNVSGTFKASSGDVTGDGRDDVVWWSPTKLVYDPLSYGTATPGVMSSSSVKII